jgi:hypothetical protein
MAGIGAAIAAVWAGAGIYLGGVFRRHAPVSAVAPAEGLLAGATESATR